MNWDTQGLAVLNKAERLASNESDGTGYILEIRHLSAALEGADATRTTCPTCGRPTQNKGMTVAARKAFEQAYKFAVDDEAQEISSRHLQQALASS